MVAAVGIIGAVIAGGAAVAQSDAARRAAHTQADAASQATGVQQDTTLQGIGAAATATGPWRNIGAGALYQLADLLGIDPRSAFPGGQGHATPLPGQGGGTPSGSGLQGVNPASIPGAGGAQSKSFLSDALNPIAPFQHAANSVQDIARGHFGGAAMEGARAGLPGPAGQTLVDTMDRAHGSVAGAIGLKKPDGSPADPTTTAAGGTTGGIPGADLIPAFPTPSGPSSNFGSLMKPFGLADFVKDPGYDFRLGEGNKAVGNNQAARGMQLSGQALKELDRYNQDYASGEFSNAYNRNAADRTRNFNMLADVAGLGQTSAQQVGSTASSGIMNFGNNAGSNIIGAGNANAAGTIGQSNAVIGGANNMSQILQQYYLRNLFANSGASGINPNQDPFAPDMNLGG